MRRRKTFSNTAVSYAAVGCTQAGDVMIFPPEGFRPTYDECRLGSGKERFETAAASLMTWGVPLGAHLHIVHVDDAAADTAGYRGLLFTEFGTPMIPKDIDSEALYSPEGTQYLSAGQSIEVSGVFSRMAAATSLRVIYVIREDRRIGYAWGTLDDTPVVGEEFFGVEWREDDSVFALVRTVTQVAQGRAYRLLTPLIRLRQWMLRRHYVRSLLPARTV